MLIIIKYNDGGGGGGGLLKTYSFFFFVVLEFELRAYTLSHSTSFFWCVIFFFFQDRVSGTILPRVGFEPRS
jgi:hypothetical protein